MGALDGRRGKKNSLEIGYAVKPQFWNKGYASEAAVALMAWAKVHRPRESLVGFALPGNVASRRILEKIGMEFLDYREIAGAAFVYYQYKI